MSSAKLIPLLQPLIEELGYEFVGLEFSSNPKNPALVIYIDRPDGIAIEDCEAVSREVAALLDVEDPIPGHYILEVSSPGVDRPLFTAAQFGQFAGETAAVTVYAPVDGRRKFKGKILSAGEGEVKIEQDGEEVVLEMSNIAKSRLVPDYDAILAAGRGEKN
ncbi:MAG: ribosome maturation factor RimP [Xanthomonadales bacterium]|nr:ribosome maturation factor RimP [Xanthomonadales bacterium]